MAVQPGEKGSGRVKQSMGASSQTIQKIVWPQAQGRAGIHQGTSATFSCSFLVPSLLLQLYSDSKSARVKGPVFTGKRVHGESTANLSVPTGPYLPSLVLAGTHQPPGTGHAHTWYRAVEFLGILPSLSKDRFIEAWPERELGRG